MVVVHIIIIRLVHIVTPRKWWLCQDIAHLHGEDIMEKGMGMEMATVEEEAEGGKL